MGQLILYGWGLIAEEYCRYLEGRGRGGDIAAFAVTCLGGQGATCCSRPCLEIGEALERFPQAEVHLALQEKYHGEVLALLAQRGREPTEIIGLHRMTELLGEQGIEEIRRACPELTVQKNPHDYSMLEISSKECPKAKFTFYPMTQDGLMAYLQDGNCSLTNNICERAVRPFTTGRKNWLFSGSEDGARASAAAYSMSETCRLNGVNFYKYLCLVFSEVPGLDFHCKPELLDRYLPWSGYIKDKCK